MSAAEEIAKEFHRVYELHAKVLGYPTKVESQGAWEDIPELNRTLMTLVVEDLLLRQVIAPGRSSLV